MAISDEALEIPHFSIEAVLEGIGEGFLALSSDWRILTFNRAAEEFTGLSRESVKGKVFWELSPNIIGSEFERRYRLTMTQRVRQEFEYRTILRPDLYAEVRVFPLGEGIGVSFRNATERLRAVEALQQREAELARVQRIGQIGGMEVDLVERRLSRRSPEYLQLHGLHPDSPYETEEDWLQRVHPEDRAHVKNRLLEALAHKGSVYQSEYRIVRPNDGETRWISSIGEIERDESGRAIKLIGAHLDTTERKKTERIALENAERLQAISDALPMMIAYLDNDLVYKFVNKPYETFYRRPLSEIVGKPIKDLMAPAMYAERLPYARRALAGETMEIPPLFTVNQVTYVPHRDENGDIFGLYILVQDITERKLAEKALVESEERFRSVANSAPAPIWVTHFDGKRAFVNLAYQEFVGLPASEARTFDWRKAIHPDDLERIVVEYRTGRNSQIPFVLEARCRRGDGAWRWMRWETRPRWAPPGEQIGYIGVAQDITIWKDAEQKLAEVNEILERRIAERTAELEAAQERLRQAHKMEALGQLTGGIAHDFNNLLTGIIGSLDLLGRRLNARRYSEIDRFMEAATSSANRAAALTNRLLAFARRQTLDSKPVEVNQLLVSIEDLLHRTLGERIELKLVPFLGLWRALIDANQLESAILNLVINARDAMPDGGSLVIATNNASEVEMGRADEPAIHGDHVVVSVADSGLGMGPEILKRAFDPFFTTKPLGQGTGLGLSMIYGFVEQSGGHVRIASEVGRGTTVKLYFPRTSIPDRTRPQPQIVDSAGGRGETILIVEDDAAVRLLVREALIDIGYKTIEAVEGAGANQLLRSDAAIDLMITDIGLPGVDGHELAKNGRAVRPGLKVVLMTAYNANADLRRTVELEGMRLIPKPFAPNELGMLVYEMLAK
jgi:PAS domain S-box-containing protein